MFCFFFGMNCAKESLLKMQSSDLTINDSKKNCLPDFQFVFNNSCYNKIIPHIVSSDTYILNLPLALRICTLQTPSLNYLRQSHCESLTDFPQSRYAKVNKRLTGLNLQL